MKLADLQAQFQRAVVEGRDDILSAIPDSPREKKETLFGVYRDAYVIRLVDILREDHERLARYIGDDGFRQLAQDYIVAYPSHTPNARYFGEAFPAFAAAHPALQTVPAAAAIAKLEGTLTEVFDITDCAPLALSGLAAFAPETFTQLVFTPHPSTRRFDTPINLDAIFSALADEDTAPPPVEICTPPQAFLVWRKDVVPHYRLLSREEAMMWDEAAKGVRFGVLCEMLATFDDPANAPLRAAQYLHGWISNGLLAGAQLAPTSAAL